MAKAPDRQNLSIPGPAGSLEALLERPAVVQGTGIAVVCHPHPQYQGTMLNKVVHTLARAANDQGVPALRFNFRGVGASAGRYAGGEGELDDLHAVVAYARQEWGQGPLWLLGFSFGAVIAARAAAKLQASRLVTVAPAVNLLGTQLQQTPAMPWLIVAGDEDDIVPLATVTDWVRTLQPTPELKVIPGASHFFHGRLMLLRRALADSFG